MDALFNNAGPSYLPPACKIVFIKCCAYYTTSPTMTHLHWCACPGWPAPAARGPRPRPGAQGAYYPRQGSLLLPSSLPVLHSGSEQPPVLSCVVVTTQAVSSPALELRLTASTPQNASSGLDPAIQICSFVWNVFWSA